MCFLFYIVIFQISSIYLLVIDYFMFCTLFLVFVLNEGNVIF